MHGVSKVVLFLTTHTSVAVGHRHRGLTLLAWLIVERLLFADAAMLKRIGNDPRTQTENRTIAHLVGIVLNRSAKGIENIRKRNNGSLTYGYLNSLLSTVPFGLLFLQKPVILFTISELPV